MIPERLAGKLALALGAAAMLLFALDRTVLFLGSGAAAASAARSAPIAGARSPEVWAAIEGPGAWLIYLAAAERDLPVLAAPVVTLRADGELRLLRPRPAAAAPRERWLAAGIVLPSARALATLDPGDRAVLLRLCAELSGGRGLAACQLVPIGMDARRIDVERLLKWQR
ncbi:MAG: hypothetical protein AAF628_16490 [Planctomycetota bacterium]